MKIFELTSASVMKIIEGMSAEFAKVSF